ncbi:MAG TPA: hypothetical protein VHN14_14330 [Kofleriaceae bacterium]|nr:hypothetical protein [Kofleriaceae bacterium]
MSALSAGIAAGDENAARIAIQTCPWVLRSFARRGLDRALFDAALATRHAGGAAEPEDPRHVLRVAALAVAGAGAGVDPADRGEVIAAYARMFRALRRKSTVRITAAITTLVVASGFAIAMVMRRPHLAEAPRGTVAAARYERATVPPTANAFKAGGQPLADPAIAELLAGDFTQLVVETDADHASGVAGSRRDAHSAELRAPAPIAAHGPELARAWLAMITMLDRWVHEPADREQLDALAAEAVASVRAVSQEFASAGLGYYLEASALASGSFGAAARSTHLLVHSYRVEEVVFVKAGDQPRRVLGLRRLDHLNVEHSELGLDSTEFGDPVLLLDQLDKHVVTRTLPVLAPRASYPLGDAPWAALPEAKQLAAAAGEVMRGELMRCLGADAEAAAATAMLLADRAEIVAGWRTELKRRNLVLIDTDELFLPDGMLRQLKGVVSPSQYTRVAAIEAELARLGAARVAAHLQDVVANSVRRHEAQHGIDRVSQLGYPAELAAYLGPFEDLDGKSRRDAQRALAELSAYVSQIANDPVTPRLEYWHVANFAFDARAWGTPESYVGVLVTAGIARRLQIAAGGPLIHDGEVDRAQLSALAAAIVAKDETALRDAARAIWQDLFGHPLTPIVDLPPRASQRPPP